jgi:hypothetical protein
MRTVPIAVALCSVFSLSAQSTVQDVGLTLTPGVLTVIYGQVCGTFSCTPDAASSLMAGSANELGVWAAGNAPFIVGISVAATPTPCVPLPGLANSLLLDPPTLVLLAVGVIPPSVPMPFGCQVARQNVPFAIPAGAPSGLSFRLQAVGTSPSSGVLAFSGAIDATVL